MFGSLALKHSSHKKCKARFYTSVSNFLGQLIGLSSFSVLNQCFFTSPIRNGITYANKGNIESVDSPIVNTLNGKIVLNTVQSFFTGRLLLKCTPAG